MIINVIIKKKKNKYVLKCLNLMKTYNTHNTRIIIIDVGCVGVPSNI